MNDQHFPAEPVQPADADLLADIQARFPNLSCDGFLGSRNGYYATPTVHLSAVPEQFAVAMAFIKSGARRSWRHSRGYYSYGLKHAAESWSAETMGVRHYVSNGAMIAAAIASGWSVERDGFDADGINAWLKPLRKAKADPPASKAA